MPDLSSYTSRTGVRYKLKDTLTRRYTKAIFEPETASGGIASFSFGDDGIAAKPRITKLAVNIDPVQSGTGDPSPDNVRPISGWTGANVHVTGKNLLAFSLDQIKAANTGGTWSDNTYNYRGISYTVMSVNNRVTEINVSGTATAVSLMYLPVNLTVQEATIITGCPAGGSSNSYVLDVNRGYYPDSGSGRNLPANYQIGSFRIRVADGFTASNLVFKPMLRFASVSDSDFEPCGTVFPISFGSAGTVYGGTLTYGGDGTWELTVTHGFIDASKYTFTKPSSGNYVYLGLSDSTNNKKPILCNVAPYEFTTGIPTRTAVWWGGATAASNKNLCIKIAENGITDSIENWNQYLQTQQLVFIYELATPITYQLTSTEMAALLGENNIWADCGEVYVEYKADVLDNGYAKAAAGEGSQGDLLLELAADQEARLCRLQLGIEEV